MPKRSFGKSSASSRSSARRPAPRKTEQVDIYEIAQQANGPFSSKGMPQTVLYSVSGVVVIGAIVLGAALFGGMSGSGGSAVPARGTPQGVALMGVISFDMLRPDNRNTLSQRDAHINSSCLKRGWLQLANSHRVMRMGDPEGKIPPRAGLSTAAATRFLSCSMRVQQRRFCQKIYRGRLAHRLKDYVSVQVFRRQRLKALMRHPSARYHMQMTQMVQEGSQSRRGRRGPTGVRSGIRPIISRDLGSAIMQLSQLGYLSPRDFGYWESSVPEPLRPYIKKATVAPVCGKTQSRG